MSPRSAHFLGTLAALLLLSSGNPTKAATLRVPQQYPDIRAAVDAAVDDDLVLVSDGVYGWFDISGKSIEIASVNGPESTIIQGPFSAGIWVSDSSSHIHGFTVRGGQDVQYAGGIQIYRGAPEIDHMIVTDNAGAITIISSQARVHHNWITGNYRNSTIEIFRSDAVVYDNLIEDNGTFHVGGGIAVVYGRPTIARNVIRGNRAESSGGGIFVQPQANPGRIRVIDNLIVDNYAEYAGGGISVYPGKHGDVLFLNNTIADNRIGSFDSAGTQAYIGTEDYFDGDSRGVVFSNNVFAGTGVSVHCHTVAGYSPIFDHNDVYPGASGDCAESAVTGTNLMAPPMFTLGDNGHPYHLDPDSPLVDAGSNDAARKLHHDLGMRPRVIDGGHGPVVDIGAFEYRPN